MAQITGFDKKKLAGIVVAVLIIVASFLIPVPEQLGVAGVRALAVLLAAVVLWIMDSFPAGVTGLLALVLMVMFGVAEPSTAYAGIGNNSIVFTIAVFALTIILTKSNLAYHIIGVMLRWAKADSKKLVLAFMMGSAVLSSIMSNLAVSAMFMGIAYMILNEIGAKPGSSNFGKCVMLGIPIAAINGGMGTPAGSSLNIVALGMMEQATGKTISFLQWTAVGFPLMLVMTPICWFFIVTFLKPEKIGDNALDELHAKINEIKQLTALDKKVLIFVIGLPLLWVLGTWIPALNMTVVAVIGLALMFMPGIAILTWDEFQNGVAWNVVLMMGAVISLGGIVSSTGGTEFIVNMFLGTGVLGLNSFLVLFLVTAFAYFLHTVLPVGPAIMTLFFVPLLGICEAAGISPAVPTMMLAFILSGNYLLPVNPNLMVTYSSGYYSAADVFKSGIVPVFAFLILFSVWVPFMCNIVGI